MLSVVVVTALLVGAPNVEGVPKKPLDLALHAARAKGRTPRLLTLIDYSRPSTEKRLWVIDLVEEKVLLETLVAHGKGSDRAGEAVRFSNRSGSRASSLGLYETLGTYIGKHGYSLKLRGLEPGFNDNAEERAVVVHGAWYVSEAFAKQHGRLGRSWGCPAVDDRVAKRLIDRIKGGSLLFVYYPDEKWLASHRK